MNPTVTDIGFLVAFGAGLLSFLSPCVLPLIPGYLSFISGYGLADIREGKARGSVLARTLAFTLGFTIVFALLGLLFAGGGALLGGGVPKLGLAAGGGLPPARIIAIVAGAVVTLLGLNLLFDVVKLLNLEARFHPGNRPRGLGGALLFGMAFAAGWSPCIGPILASILLFAARESDLGKSLLLLLAYSAGLALPFVAVGLFFDRLKPLLDFFRRRAREVRIVSGLLLVVIGIVMIVGRLSAISSAAVNLGFSLQSAAGAHPDAARLWSGGAWLILAIAMIVRAVLAWRGSKGRVALVAALVFAAFAVAEFAGLLSTATLLSKWLLFQGA
ncbi:MAG: cytochrome c biogenesis protein CcdA [Rectinemataceae bacterium]